MTDFLFFGQMAALLTAVLWAVSAAFFAIAGRTVNSIDLNRLRMIISLLLLFLIHWLLFKTPFPHNASLDRWMWLGLSGIIGFAIGDTLLFEAYAWLGARLAMLLKSLAPLFSALLGWLFLSETLSFVQIFGMLLTVGGISWVITQRNQTDTSTKPIEARQYVWGIFCGVGTAFTQALALVLAKKGLGGEFSAWSANVMRMFGGVIVLWGSTIIQGQAIPTLRHLQSPQISGLIGVGTFLGAVVGVWLSLLAVQTTNVGIASTLMALVPIFMLPIGYFFFKERFGWSVIVGTVVAVVGVGVLFLTG